MTTIAGNLACLAADQRCSGAPGEAGMTVQKIFRIGKGIYGGAGDLPALCAFMDWKRRGGRGKRPVLDGLSADILELTSEGLFYWDGGDRIKLRSGFYAIGSGAFAALGAMEMGASPTRAVQIAGGFDPFTGTTVDTIWLDQKKQKVFNEQTGTTGG